jgi:hypothetical protein
MKLFLTMSHWVYKAHGSVMDNIHMYKITIRARSATSSLPLEMDLPVDVLGESLPERHDQCASFDGEPCDRDQGVLVGAVDSYIQGEEGKRITVSSIQIHKEETN